MDIIESIREIKHPIAAYISANAFLNALVGVYVDKAADFRNIQSGIAYDGLISRRIQSKKKNSDWYATIVSW